MTLSTSRMCIIFLWFFYINEMPNYFILVNWKKWPEFVEKIVPVQHLHISSRIPFRKLTSITFEMCNCIQSIQTYIILKIYILSAFTTTQSRHCNAPFSCLINGRFNILSLATNTVILNLIYQSCDSFAIQHETICRKFNKINKHFTMSGL